MTRKDGRKTGYRPGAQALEGRALRSELTFAFDLADPTGEFAAHPGLKPALEAAGAHLGSYLDGKGVLEVEVRPVREPGQMLARNTYTTETTLGPGGPAMTTTHSATLDRGHLVEPNPPLEEARTGVDPNGDAPDLRLTVNLANLDRAWFDPSGPERSAPVPAERVDFVGVVLHELIHGLGVSGSLTPPRQIASPLPGAEPIVLPGRMTGFTRLTSQGEALLPDREVAGVPVYFLGAKAQEVFGGPVPVLPGGLVGGPTDLPDPATTAGVRFPLRDLDLAILADLGWSVRSYPGSPTPAPGRAGNGPSGGAVSVMRVEPEATPRGVSAMTLRLSGPVDPASAGDLGRYALEGQGRGRAPGRGRAATPRVERLPLASASYDPATASIRLVLARPLPPGKAATLKADLSGMLDPSGRPLAGEPPAFSAVVRGVRGGAGPRAPRR